MSSSQSNDSKRVLYLEQINTQTSITKKLRFELQVDGKHVEIRQEKGLSIWIPARSPELEDASKVTVIIRAGHLPLRKRETHLEFTGRDAIEVFWESTDSISREVTFGQQTARVTFRFRPSPTSETTREAVQNLESAMETYDVLMKDSTEKKIDLVFKHGAVLAEMNPIVSAAFSIVKGVFEVLKEQKKYDGMVSDLAEEIARITPFTKLVLEEIVCDETELLYRAVTKMCTLVMDTAKFVCGYAKQSIGIRTINSAISSDAHAKIGAFKKDFATLKEDFDRAVDVTALKIGRDSRSKLISLALEHEAAEEWRRLDQLKPINGKGYDEDHSCMEGTRTALLSDILAWSAKAPEGEDAAPNGHNTDSVFWLYGIPGVGKTYVASSLCRLLREKGNLGGSFFCRRDDPNRGEPKQVLPNLIHRLAATWSPYRKLVAQALRDQTDFSPNSSDSERLFKRLQSLEDHPPSTLVLVVDAFDECGEPRTRRQLLNTLLEVCSGVHWLKIVITSRKEYDITPFFDKIGVAGRDLAAEDHTHEDIQLFTKKRMASIATDYHLSDDWPGDDRLEQIVERSGDLFIFVNTVCLLVDDPDPEAALGMVLSGELEGANAELHKLYSKILVLRVGRSQEKFRSFARAFIVVAAYRPLSGTTLASLTGLDLSTIRSWLDGLSSLLYQDGSKKGGIRVRHLSVIEFLTGPTCPSEFRVDLQQANAELSLRCLTTMTKELKFNICELETSLLTNTEIKELDNRVNLKIPDALQYSCMHWSSHLCSDPAPASVEVSTLLDGFLMGPRPLYWIEVLSVMGKVPVGISALRDIKTCIEKFQDRHGEPVDDILRLLLAFFTPISTSAPHIYISALPYMPVDSMLWKNANKSFPKIMNVCKGHMQSWPTLPDTWLGHTSYVSSVAYSPDGRYVASGSYDDMIRIWDTETGRAMGEPLRGHTGYINSVAYSPDGHRVVSGSRDNTIRIWDAETGEAVGEPLREHTGYVYSVAYSPDGHRVVSGSSDKTIRIWDAETGEAVGEPLRGHTGSILSVAYSPDGHRVVSGSDDYTIRIWDAETGEAVGEPLRGHTGSILSVAYSPDGHHVVSGSSDKTIRFWDAETGEAVGEPLRGHTGSILSVAYSPDGHRVVSGSDDGTIRIWDAENGEAVGEPLRGHTGYIFSVAYSPDGHRVVSGSSDYTIRIWDADTGEAVGEPLRGHTSEINSVAYSPDGHRVVSGSDDNTIRIWDAETGEAVGEPLRGHTGYVYSVAYSPDGHHVVSGSSDKTIRIWDAETGEAVGEPLRGHTNEINSVAYSPDGHRVVSGSDDNTIQIWDAETGEAVGEPLRGHTSYIYSIAYSPNGHRVVSGSRDDTIRIWDAETGEAVGEPLRGHTGSILSVAYSPDGHRIVSGSSDNTIRIWDAETGEAVGEPLMGHTGSILSVAYSPDGHCIVSGSRDNTIRIWDSETGEAVGEPLRGHTSYINSVAYSPDGHCVVSSSRDNTIRFWDAETGEAVGEPLRGHTNDINSVAYSPDGHCVVSGSRDNTILIWDAETGEAVGEPLRGHTNEINSVAYSPDGRRVVSGSRDNTIRIWDAETGEAVGEPLRGHTNDINSVAYSPDGHRVVSGSRDNTIRIWDAETGEAVGEPLRGHTNNINSVAYSPDGHRVVSGSRDNTIRIWDAETGVAVGEPLRGHTDWVRSVAYSPDGHRVVSGSDDNTIRIWDTETGEAVGEPLRGHTDWVHSVAYSPDGHRVVSGSDNGTIRIWNAGTGEAVGEPLRGHTGYIYSVAYSPNGHRVVSGSDDNTIRIWDAEKQSGQPMVLDTNEPSTDISGSRNPVSTNHPSLSAFSSLALPTAAVDPNGWVLSEEGLLFWVPEDCRHGITCPAIMTIPNNGRQRCLRVDLNNFQYGKSWTNVYGGA